jgi:hypothetical protein
MRMQTQFFFVDPHARSSIRVPSVTPGRWPGERGKYQGRFDVYVLFQSLIPFLRRFSVFIWITTNIRLADVESNFHSHSIAFDDEKSLQ